MVFHSGSSIWHCPCQLVCPGELAVQIEKEVYKFNKLLGLRSTTFAGGLSKYQQFRTIKGGAVPVSFCC